MIHDLIVGAVGLVVGVFYHAQLQPRLVAVYAAVKAYLSRSAP